VFITDRKTNFPVNELDGKPGRYGGGTLPFYVAMRSMEKLYMTYAYALQVRSMSYQLKVKISEGN
jgi:hypothetical protein